MKTKLLIGNYRLNRGPKFDPEILKIFKTV